MQVNSYIFQSPYSSQVQVGRLDTSKNTQSSDDKSDSKQSEAVNIPPNTAQALQENESKLKVAKAIEDTSTLDIYA